MCLFAEKGLPRKKVKGQNPLWMSN